MMDSHPVDSVALISGLLFSLAGLAILARQRWEDVDITALTAAGVTLTGLVLTAMIVYRSVRSDAERDDPGNET